MPQFALNSADPGQIVASDTAENAVSLVTARYQIDDTEDKEAAPVRQEADPRRQDIEFACHRSPATIP
jgi:hypothetical protein